MQGSAKFYREAFNSHASSKTSLFQWALTQIPTIPKHISESVSVLWKSHPKTIYGTRFIPNHASVRTFLTISWVSKLKAKDVHMKNWSPASVDSVIKSDWFSLLTPQLLWSWFHMAVVSNENLQSLSFLRAVCHFLPFPRSFSMASFSNSAFKQQLVTGYKYMRQIAFILHSHSWGFLFAIWP